MKRRQITVEDLEACLTEHRRWLESQGHEGTRADLSGLNINGKNLRNADLRRAHMKKTQFIWADLRGANLSYAEMAGARFNQADLTGCVLIGAKLKGAIFMRANLEDANFEGAHLKHVDFRETCMAEIYPSFEVASDDLNAIRYHMTAASEHIVRLLLREISALYDRGKRAAFRQYLGWKRRKSSSIMFARGKDFP